MRQQELMSSPSFEPDVTAALLKTCEETLIDLEEALALLARGDYGSCPDCGIAVPFERAAAQSQSSGSRSFPTPVSA